MHGEDAFIAGGSDEDGQPTPRSSRRETPWTCIPGGAEPRGAGLAKGLEGPLMTAPSRWHRTDPPRLAGEQ